MIGKLRHALPGQLYQRSGYIETIRIDLDPPFRCSLQAAFQKDVLVGAAALADTK